jgi:predicted ferric reductase
MKYIYWGLFWVGVYLGLILMPSIALFLGPMPAGSGLWWDLSIALGFAGTSMMGVMFFLTARFKRASFPFGIDLIYYFHRQIALIAFSFLLAHPVIMFAQNPGLLSELAPQAISGYLLAGVGSIAALLALVITSLFRKQLKLHYDGWRIWHALLAVAAFVLAIIHIEGVANYVAMPLRKGLWTVIMASWILLLFYIRLIKPFHLSRLPYRVEKVIKERGDAWTLVLSPDGHLGLRFLPGQFCWLTLWSSPFALKEHPFSISSSAEAPEKLHFTIKALGDFTRRIKNVLPRQRAYLDGPYGSFSIDRHHVGSYCFIAGGIGIAPIMGMLRTLADRRESRPLTLIYAYNTLERLTFYEEIEGLKKKLPLTVIYVLFSPPDGWQGERGFITEELLQAQLPKNREDTQCFVCGPVPMIQLAEKSLHRLGVPLAHIHSELFDLV